MNGGGLRPPGRQRGVVVPMVAGALIAIFAVAALALDLGNAYVNKGLLQNSVDAAALSAARVLAVTGDTGAARVEAEAVFTANAEAVGNALLAGLEAESLTLTVEFGATPWSLGAGAPPARYVRVRAAELSVVTWFARVIGFDALTVGGAAVAGPSSRLAEVCNAVPLVICGEEGYDPRGAVQLELSTHFHVIDPGPGLSPGEGLAGSYAACLRPGDEVTLEPVTEDTLASLRAGLNTRFGEYSGLGPAQYPPDIVVASGYDYEQYRNALVEPTSAGGGVAGRRVLALPIADCAVGAGRVHGFRCLFLREPVGEESDVLAGEFIGSCPARGVPGQGAGGAAGPYTIQLYKDPDSIDS